MAPGTDFAVNWRPRRKVKPQPPNVLIPRVRKYGLMATIAADEAAMAHAASKAEDARQGSTSTSRLQSWEHTWDAERRASEVQDYARKARRAAHAGDADTVTMSGRKISGRIPRISKNVNDAEREAAASRRRARSRRPAPASDPLAPIKGAFTGVAGARPKTSRRGRSRSTSTPSRRADSAFYGGGGGGGGGGGRKSRARAADPFFGGGSNGTSKRKRGKGKDSAYSFF